MNTRQYIKNKRQAGVNFIRRGKRYPQGTASTQAPCPQGTWPFPTEPPKKLTEQEELDAAYERAMKIL